MKRVFRLTALAAFVSLGTGTAVAQTNQSASYSDNRPQRGMSMDAVARAYGEPALKRAAVGQPPITRWEYGEFIVYFEYNRVIHAVLTQ